MQQITHALVPGTFDPITFGHIDVARRTSRLFPRVTVAVAESLGKNGVGTVFTLDERVELARTALSDIPNVDVQPFCGLLVDFARQVGAGAVVKGLRAMTDFEYELQQADLNYRLDSELESNTGTCPPPWCARLHRLAGMYRNSFPFAFSAP